MALSDSANSQSQLTGFTNAAPVVMALAGARTLIEVVGFRRSTAVIWWLADHLPAPRQAEHEGHALAEAQARIIARIANRLPSRPRCLPRALLLAGLLRRRRISAELCLGARVGGAFDAHAWIEIEGRPVNEAADLHTTYRCLWRRPVLGVLAMTGNAHAN